MTSEPVSRLPDPKYAEALAESRQDAEFWDRKDGALRTAIAERDEARDRVDELERNAEVVSSEFEGDCWKAVRRLLDECNFDWRGVEDSEGVSADTAEEHIKTTLDELERDADRLRARAEAAEAHLEELTRERDEARDTVDMNHAACQRAEARLEEAKAVLEALLNEIESGIDPLDHRHDRKRYDKARAFLHHGGSDAR